MNIALRYEDILKSISRERVSYMIFKRMFDITASLAGIILLSPLFLIVGAAIVLDSGGPAIFSQARSGKNGKSFKMLKFRSMVHNAEDLLQGIRYLNGQSGPVFKMRNDPRVTRVGRFIRRTSIDELPQLFNVLKGDMSIVGPRPPIPCEVEHYSDIQRIRLAVKPGLTCYWQVMGRNSLDFNKWVELDIKYIMERNLRIDLMLVLKTLKVLFGDKNAW